MALAVLTFVLWGLYPFYFQAIAAVDPLEIVANRFMGSFVLALVAAPILGLQGQIRAIFQNRRQLSWLAFTSCLMCANQLTYVVAVNTGHVLDASLGYFLSPLFAVALGLTVQGERLSRVQLLAVGLAAVAVLNLVYQLGVVPVVALFLGGSFALYALMRKRLGVAALPGMFVENALALPISAVMLVIVQLDHGMAMLEGDPTTVGLLLLAGFVTLGPLLLFNLAAARTRLATLGILQYIAPSLLFLESVLVFGEPLVFWRLVTFLVIWTALVLYTTDGFVRARRLRAAQR